MALHAAILAGGSGTRFWPASTRAVPKQMLALTGGEPLLRETVARLGGLVPPERTLIVTSASQVEAARAMLPELPPQNVLGEPQARNTAAACALAAWACRLQDDDPTLITLPSDHVIAPAEDLRDSLAAAAARVEETDGLLTLGLIPTRPATGYGWIELGDEAATVDGHRVHGVRRFVEKPDRAKAEALLAAGGHLWNLGMFAWKAEAFLRELATHLPQVAEPLAAVAPALGTPGQADALAAAYDRAMGISVDYGVLERTERLECLPCSFHWDDLGSFAALMRHLEADADGNVGSGARLLVETADCTTWANDGELTALLGVEDLIVVHAGRVTMVAPRGRAEEVRRLVDGLGAAGLEDFA
jgi:mannose-1-phosphate guanylyltransferase